MTTLKLNSSLVRPRLQRSQRSASTSEPWRDPSRRPRGGASGWGCLGAARL